MERIIIRSVLALFIAVSSLCPVTNYANPYPAPPYFPPAGHPRLFVRGADLPVIKQRFESSVMSGIRGAILNHAGYTSSGAVTGTPPNYNTDIRSKIEANALLYLLRGDITAAHTAIDVALAYMESVQFGWGDETAEIGATLTAGALVYDWCHGVTTAPEKQRFLAAFERLIPLMSIGWPPEDNEGRIVGHDSEMQLQRDILSVGVAVFDEHRNIYDIAAGTFFDGYRNARNFFNAGHAHIEGDSYGSSRLLCDLFAAHLFNRMGYADVFTPDLGKVPHHWLYLRRPDGLLMRDGDSWQASQYVYGEYWNRCNAALMLSASLYKDPYAHTEFLKQGSLYPAQLFTSPVWSALFYDPTVPVKPLEELPKTKHFAGPIGMMIARTGWDTGKNASAAVATMKIGEYQLMSHRHLDAGHFQLYYKGLLASDTGMYASSSGGYGNPHDYNYHKRTIAHNTMLVYDPNEQFNLWANILSNDGGQRITEKYGSKSSIERILADETLWRAGRELAADFGPDANTPAFSYLKADITAAYSSKMKRFLRTFLFLNLGIEKRPAVFIVYDKVVSSNPSFRKIWNMHCVEAPVTGTASFDVTRKQSGYGGRLFCNTILPPQGDVSISIQEGPGKEFSYFGNRFMTWAMRTNNCDAAEARGYRIEISPVSNALTNFFLNVMQIMDADGTTSPLALEPVASDSLVGARLSNAVFIFSRDGEPVSRETSFTIPGAAGTVSLFIGDLVPGRWALSSAGVPDKIIEVRAGAGNIYCTASAGVHVLKPWSGNPVQTNTADTQPGASKNGIDNITAVNNPCRDCGNITLVNVPADANAAVYSVSGRLICNIGPVTNGDSLSWDLCDMKGKKVPAGVYLCRLSSASGIKIIKVLVQR